MEEPLRVLIVEDEPDDAALILREVRRAGFTVQDRRVESAAGLAKALREADWDLIIADYAMPGFGGLEALRMVQEQGLDIPFIVVSGAITEETAVAAMKSGAHDYVLKNNMARLAPAVARELREAELRRERRRVESELASVKDRWAADLQRSRDELAVILRNVAEGILAEDAAGHLIYVNDTAARLSGYPRAEEMLSATPADVAARRQAWDDTGHPLAPEQLPPARALAGKSAVEMVVRSRDVVTSDERWSVVSSTPIFDDRRGSWATITFFSDITDHKRAAETARYLSDASEALASSLEYGPTLAAIAHLPVPRLAEWAIAEGATNGARTQLAAAHADPSRARLVRELFERGPAVVRALLGTDRAERTRRPEHRNALPMDVSGDSALVRLLRELHPRASLAIPLLAQDQVLGSLTLVVSDSGQGIREEELAFELARRSSLVLEKAWLYRQAQSAIEARDEFLSIASHELRTPLTALMLQLQRLQRTLREPAQESVKLDLAVRQAQRLSGLIDSLLDVSRVTAGRLTLQREELDLSALVRQVVDRMSEHAMGAACQIRMEIEDSVIGAWDRARMEQVVTNLLSNAYKYGSGHSVEIRLTRHDAEADLSVTDHGIGIAAENATRIFERFERAVSARNYGGLGLGLFIVKQIVQAHGGTISVESEVGAGSTFRVALPLAPGSRMWPQPPPQQPAWRSSIEPTGLFRGH